MTMAFVVLKLFIPCCFLFELSVLVRIDAFVSNWPMRKWMTALLEALVEYICLFDDGYRVLIGF